MKHTLRTSFILLLALFSASFAHAQDGLLDRLLDGFTMPMRITGAKANTSVDIGIDTIRYLRGDNKNEVSFDAYAKLQIPFAIEDGKESTKIEFRGTNLMLAGNGSTTISAEIPLSPIVIKQDKLRLRLDGASISLNCDGVEAISLQGAFLFHQSFIESAFDPAQEVEATFDITVADWDDLMFAVNFSTPFRVKGCGNFIFTVQDAVVDFSTQTNAPGFSFPAGYDTGFLNGDENLWTGFALKKLIATPPEEINKLDGDESRPFTFEVTNMLIDESGLTGSFQASRSPRTDNQNSGLNVSINKIGVSIMQGYIVGGIIAGDATVPLLKDPQKDNVPLSLALTGQIQYDRAEEKLLYRIDAETLNESTYGVPFAKEYARITLSKGCSFTVGNMNEQGKFGATLVLNGKLIIAGGNSGLNIAGIRFESLTLSTFDPYFNWTYFGLTSTVGMDYAGFSISLKKLELKKTSDERLALSADMMLALMDGPMSIAVETGFTITAQYESNSWNYKGIKINSISLDLDFSAFRFTGDITLYDETIDTKYGNGFEGDITLTLKTLGFGVEGHIQFGNTNYDKSNPKVPLSQSYKYWNAQITANVSGSNILLFPPAVMLKDITGGVYQHMSNTLYEKKKQGEDPLPLPKEIDYVPDQSVSFGFVAGVGAYFAQDKLVSANVLLEMAFNSHFGLKYVALQGMASIIVVGKKDPDEPDKGVVNANLLSYYDVDNKIFSADVGVTVDFVKLITGEGRVNIYTSPDTWYCYVGEMHNPNTLSFIDLVDVKSYLMFGAIPSELPPLNPRILALFGSETYSNAGGQEDTTLQGKGFAFGISLSADCGFGKKRGFLFAYVEVEGGTDALVNLKPHNCGDFSVDWRAYGQAYAYVNGEFGVRVRRKKFRILQVSAATVLAAQFPAPYYLSGRVGFKFQVLFIKGKVTVGYSAGKSCKQN